MKIGLLRRSLFVDYDCYWNKMVRELTAFHESHDEETNECAVYADLLTNIKMRAFLDNTAPYPESSGKISRMHELFEESK